MSCPSMERLVPECRLKLAQTCLGESAKDYSQMVSL